jgi:glycogen phosphorylase
MVRPVSTISVIPNLPPALERLRELAYNLHWAWDHETIALFRRLDRDLWERTNHNPVLMLGKLSQRQLDELAQDDAFLAHLDRACESFDRYMSNKTGTWYAKRYNDGNGNNKLGTIAYFSMEFGITESLRNYSGGLGILSGDHLKSSSDLGLPLVGVGLLYQEGYFSQYLNADGYQQEAYPINDYANLPVIKLTDAKGEPMLVKVPLPGRTLYAQVWRVQVGRVPLLLLDTNIPQNSLAEDRDLTDRLYGGDRRQRIRQEILFGIGGIQALEMFGVEPTVYHMNEGHSAFLGLERVRRLLASKPGITFNEAREICRAGNIFTTHTPVPAGLERFGYDLIDEHFGYLYPELGLTREQFHDLGRENMGSYDLFSMAVLALKMSGSANGVAKLHGEVSRRLWQWMYPNLPQNEIPVGHVTNGIHVQSFVSNEMGQLFDRYLDPSWRDNPSDTKIWADVELIPDAELWRAHERRRERLVSFARERLRSQLVSRGATASELEVADEVLNPDVLTIGFARRFATYKRATMIFQDRERLAKLLNDPNRPVQLIFAGKAHPHDIPGKELIREIVNMARQPEFRHKVVFLENYDMNIARHMVQGVDVWLNNPRRPEEASGTSGMKAIYNGALNCSTLDGWWDEGYDPSVGWQIGNGEEYSPEQYGWQDHVEAQALYTVLEHDIVPLFYERARDGLPREWIARMKNSIKKLAPFFNTHRMIAEYTDLYYAPAHERYMRLSSSNMQRGIEFARWREHMYQVWNSVAVQRVETSSNEIRVGNQQQVRAWVALGDLTPDDVTVQLYHGDLDTHGNIITGEAIDMSPVGKGSAPSVWEFTTNVAFGSTGNHGVSVRVLPKHPDLPSAFERGLIRWA